MGAVNPQGSKHMLQNVVTETTYRIDDDGSLHHPIGAVAEFRKCCIFSERYASYPRWLCIPTAEI